MVMKGCFSVGLYWQGLLHDLSKYMPSEFVVGARYYQGTQSPNNAERRERGYSSAWLHHKGRNKHHYEYWMDYSAHAGDGIIPAKMPDRYIVEMFIDRVAGNSENFIHPATRRKLEKLLRMLAERGEAYTMLYIRRKIIPKIKKQSFGIIKQRYK